MKNYGKMLRKRIYAEIDDFEKMDKVEALFEQPLPPLPTLEPRPKKARQGFSEFYIMKINNIDFKLSINFKYEKNFQIRKKL